METAAVPHDLPRRRFGCESENCREGRNEANVTCDHFIPRCRRETRQYAFTARNMQSGGGPPPPTGLALFCGHAIGFGFFEGFGSRLFLFGSAGLDSAG